MQRVMFMAANPNVPLLIALIFVQLIFVCMAYGPIAAYLVEAFPAKIRYTSISSPYSNLLKETHHVKIWDEVGVMAD